jgi:hypothetical protein
MATWICCMAVTWQGLFAGVEQTAYWRQPFKQPGLTASVVALVGVNRVSLRVVYLQPLQRGGFGPAVQLGASVKVF